MSNQTITAVPGLSVGHHQDHDARTGCTVIIGSCRGAAYVAGFATGTRELDVLNPAHLAPSIDALFLTGGSAFGLAAAEGVVRWLEERGRGFQTPAARVPIVPAAVLYDLHVGDARRRPDAVMAYTACSTSSTDPVAEGAVGAGTGATVGKILGIEGAAPGGVGSWNHAAGGYMVGALAVVNALGDVLSEDGTILAGARYPNGRFVNTLELLRQPDAITRFSPQPTNTTLAVVATDAPLSRLELHMLARQSANALARRIAPVFTAFDGDIVFALSTAEHAGELDPGLRLALSAAAQRALEIAIERAVMVSGNIVSRRSESA